MYQNATVGWPVVAYLSYHRKIDIRYTNVKIEILKPDLKKKKERVVEVTHHIQSLIKV